MTVVIDLRAGECDVEQVEGRVVALDHAESAADHDDVYQALLGSPRVYGLICLAVGTDNTAARVRPAPSLAPVDRAVTLWIGHEHGVRWQPTDPYVSAVPATEQSGLAKLIGVLGQPSVFDGVVRAVSTLPYSTAAVGMALKWTSLHGDELRRVRDEAIAEFTDPDAGHALARELPRAEFRAAVRAVVKVDLDEEVLVPEGELAKAHLRAIRAVNDTEHEFALLHDFLPPMVKRRTRQRVAEQAEQAYAAAAEFLDRVRRQLQRVDDNLRGRPCPREQVVQLGVHGPVTAYPRQARDDVRAIVERWLAGYRSIAHLRPDLDKAKIEQAPQGCLDAVEQSPEAPEFPADPAPSEWRWNIRRWKRKLAMDQLRATVARADQLLDGVLRKEWRTSARRALFSDGLRQAAAALSVIQQVIVDQSGELFAKSIHQGDSDDPPDRDIYEEVRDVVVTDLVDLTVAALRPCWAGIEARGAVDRTVFAELTARLLDDYHQHVERHGLLPAPPFGRGDDRREVLGAKMWASSEVTAELSVGVDERMVQLCHASHLLAMSALAEGARLVRFAPAAVRRLGRDDLDSSIIWTGDAEVAGTLRFVPLRSGVLA